MGVGLLMTLAVLAAVISAGVRRWRRNQLRYGGRGSTASRPIEVSRFEEIDAEMQQRRCGWCGGGMRLAGETSRDVGQRRFRVVRLVCDDCERDTRIYFDVTRVFH